MRDHRVVPGTPAQRFGYNTERMPGRFIKGMSQYIPSLLAHEMSGDVREHLFACGDREGFARIWDLRNVKRPPDVVSGLALVCGLAMTGASRLRLNASANREFHTFSLRKIIS